MRLFRIGDKVVSREKLVDELSAILEDRERGATQEDAAARHGVQRSFVSWVESLGEVRRGPKLALVGFPVANASEVKALAQRYAVDFTLVLSQSEREGLETGDAAEVFNTVLDTLATLRDFDTIILAASDWRISTIERILGREVIGITLGPSPLRSDVTIDPVELDTVLAAVTGKTRTASSEGGAA